MLFSALSDLMSQYVIIGDFLGFLNAMYTVTLADFFYGGIFMIFIIPIYSRTQSWLYVSATLIFLSTFFYALTPTAAIPILKVVIVISIGGTLFYLFTRVSA